MDRSSSIWSQIRNAVPRPRRRVLVLALLATVLLHAVVFGITYWVELSLETWSTRVAARIHADLARETNLDFEPPRQVEPVVTPKPEPAQTPPPSPVEEPEPAVAEREDAPEPRDEPQPKGPAEAARTLVAEGPGPVSEADFTMVQGAGERYAGGVTTPLGTEKEAVHELETLQPSGPTNVAEPQPEPAEPVEPAEPEPPRFEGPDRSRPLGIANPAWTCPWPREADEERIDTQSVLLRVIVSPSGEVEDAQLIKDPGNGFGAAALACARRTRFLAARDPRGEAIRAEAPVRVRFSR